MKSICTQISDLKHERNLLRRSKALIDPIVYSKKKQLLRAAFLAAIKAAVGSGCYQKIKSA